MPALLERMSPVPATLFDANMANLFASGDMRRALARVGDEYISKLPITSDVSGTDAAASAADMRITEHPLHGALCSFLVRLLFGPQHVSMLNPRRPIMSEGGHRDGDSKITFLDLSFVIGARAHVFELKVLRPINGERRAATLASDALRQAIEKNSETPIFRVADCHVDHSKVQNGLKEQIEEFHKQTARNRDAGTTRS